MRIKADLKTFLLCLALLGATDQAPGATPADAAYAAIETLAAADSTVKPDPALALLEAVQVFVRDYPEDTRRWDAVYLLTKKWPRDASQEQKRQFEATSMELVSQGLAAGDIGDRTWQDLMRYQFYRVRDRGRAAFLRKEVTTVDIRPLEPMLEQFHARYPQSEYLRAMESSLVDDIAMSDETAARARLEKLTASVNAAVAAQAQGMLLVRRLLAGEQPVALEFDALDGPHVNLRDYRGKVVLVEFWATWCGICVEEIPNIQRVYEKYHNRGFEVLAVTLDGPQDAGKVRAFVRERQLSWPQYLDTENKRNRLATEFGIYGIPMMFLVDREGMLVTTSARGARLEEEVSRLLGK